MDKLITKGKDWGQATSGPGDKKQNCPKIRELKIIFGQSPAITLEIHPSFVHYN